MLRSVLIVCVFASSCTVMSVPDASVEELDSGVDGGAVDAGPTCGCESWGNARSNGTFSGPLDELSGLVASRTHAGVFYAHNDSGDSPRFFAVSQTAQILETFQLTGATAIDWEDIGLGPCPSGTCIFLGDVGDNAFARADYAIYRVAEPTSIGSGTTTVAFEKFRFEYPSALQHNSEAIFVHPITGRVYLVTKSDTGASQVFRFPLVLDAAFSATLELVATLSIPTATDRPVTAADVNACGTGVLVRMYNRLVEYRLPAGETNFEQIFTVAPVNVPFANEPQGEAVAYGPDGRTYFTSSEKLADDPALFEYRCR